MTASMFPRVPRPKARTPRKAAAKSKATVHVFVWDASSDWRGIATCTTCGGLRTDSVHRLARRSDDEREHEARRMGEGE